MYTYSSHREGIVDRCKRELSDVPPGPVGRLVGCKYLTCNRVANPKSLPFGDRSLFQHRCSWSCALGGRRMVSQETGARRRPSSFSLLSLARTTDLGPRRERADTGRRPTVVALLPSGKDIPRQIITAKYVTGGTSGVDWKKRTMLRWSESRGKIYTSPGSKGLGKGSFRRTSSLAY